MRNTHFGFRPRGASEEGRQETEAVPRQGDRHTNTTRHPRGDGGAACPPQRRKARRSATGSAPEITGATAIAADGSGLPRTRPNVDAQGACLSHVVTSESSRTQPGAGGTQPSFAW